MTKTLAAVLLFCMFLSVLICLRSSTVIEVQASNGYRVHNLNTGLNYTTIQAAINASQTLGGHTIFVEKGVYYEHLVVNKSLSLIGENRTSTIIDGNSTEVVIIVEADNVTVKGFTVRHGNTGIRVDYSKNSLIENDNVTKNNEGISVRFSSNCTVYDNSVGDNIQHNTLVTNSGNFTLKDNDIYGSGGYGINANASSNGLIARNNVHQNYYDGIGLLDSNNTKIVENLVESNTFIGIWIDTSDYNSIYHNNIVTNGFQARSNSMLNYWNNTMEGNYWSDYTGVDLGHDGIGDSWYEIFSGNIDHYPLMGRFSSFNTSSGHDVGVISNSTVQSFEYVESNSAIRMLVSNMTSSQTTGFCRVCIAHGLMNPVGISVIIDDGLTPVLYHNYSLYDNGTHRWIYFTYEHSTHEIIVVPEVPVILTVPFLVVATLPAVLLYKKRRTKPIKKPISF
jgi:parallel beta-helix repeat protein